MFLVTLHRSGPQWDASKPLEEQSGWPEHAAFMDGLVDDGFIVLGGPLADEHRVMHAVEAESEDAVRATFGRGVRSGCAVRARARPLERDAPPRRRGRTLDDPARRALRLGDHGDRLQVRRGDRDCAVLEPV